MKRIALLILLSCAFSFSASAGEQPETGLQPAGEPPRAAETAPPQTPVKIGYVDMAKVAGDSAQGKAANAKLKEKTEKLRSQIVGKQKTLEKMKKDLEAQLPTLSPQQRQARIKALEKKVTEYQKFVQGAEKDMQKMEGELSEAMIKAIQKAADDYGRANGFAAIVPKRDLFYLGDKVEAIDVTGDLMKIIP